MTFEEINAIAQPFGVVAAIASLVFVGLQIRQNTAATQAASHHAVSDSFNELNRMFAESGEVTRIYIAGRADRQALTEEERWRFDSAMRAYMHICETMFIQASLGVGDKGIWFAEQEGIRATLTFRGTREWWDENPFGFCEEFRAFVATLAPPKETMS